MTLANKITLTRLLLIPVFIIGLLLRAVEWPVAVFAVCALTDVLDGIVARRGRQKSLLGSLLDPVADKLLLNASFLVLAFQGRVPAWFFVVVFSRDLLILIGWNIIHLMTQRSSVEPRWSGKGTTLLQTGCVIVVLVPALAPALHAAILAATLSTAISTADYVLWGGRLLSRFN